MNFSVRDLELVCAVKEYTIEAGIPMMKSQLSSARWAGSEMNGTDILSYEIELGRGYI